jgi:UDP-glucose 4-epimerase
MQVVVTGAHGKVGTAVVRRLGAAGHIVRAVDRTPPVFERGLAEEPDYLQGDLTDPAVAHAAVLDADAVVHAAAIPAPNHHAPERVLSHNVVSTANLVEASVRLRVPRFVLISSEAVAGYVFPSGSGTVPDYLPVDEDHPTAPTDAYGLSKHIGEQLVAAACMRSGMRAISLRPSWVQWAGNYERNLGPQVRDPGIWSDNAWSYVDVEDLADAVLAALTAPVEGHEVCLIAAADNATGRPLAELHAAAYGDRVELRPHDPVDASGISCDRARTLLGWEARRSWRDHLDAQGRLRPAHRVAGTADEADTDGGVSETAADPV